MNNITKLPIGNSTDDARALALIRRTVASDCNDAEFDLFIWTARHLGLDPLRRQIFALVYNKDKPSKRKMTIITAIDGLRAIADRTGNYRPDDDEPTIESDMTLVSDHNPSGLVKATVRVYKFSHGSWHKVTASAYWNEFAPIKDGWSETRSVQNGTWPDGNPKYKEVPSEGAKKIQVLDTSGQWVKMPRVMLAKVAEAQALRKAWPDAFSGVATDDETDRARVLEMSASEAAEEGERIARLEKIGSKDCVPLTFDNSGTIEMVPVGMVADRALSFLQDNADNRSAIMLWRDRNIAGLREFWAKAPGDALAVKKEIEKVIDQ
jgi:phage recombination protein Bet